MCVVKGGGNGTDSLTLGVSWNCVGVCDTDIILDTFQWHANYFHVAMAMKLIILLLNKLNEGRIIKRIVYSVQTPGVFRSPAQMDFN